MQFARGTVKTLHANTPATSSYLNRRLRDLVEAEKEISRARSVLQDFRDIVWPDVKVNTFTEGDIEPCDH